MTGFLLLFARIPVLVLAVVTALGLLGTSALSVQAVTAVQQVSQSQLQAAQNELTARIAEAVLQRATLAVAIDNAQTLLKDSEGKTLDDTARAALNTAIAEAQQTLGNLTSQIANAQAELAVVQSETDFVFPWQAVNVANTLTSVPLPHSTEISDLVSSLGGKITAVKDAQTAWQAEQDRIAAEAARAAAARAAAARAAAERAAA